MRALLVVICLVCLYDLCLGKPGPVGPYRRSNGQGPVLSPGGRPAIRPPGPPGTSGQEPCVDARNITRPFGSQWSDDWYTCKCVRYDYGLFSVPPPPAGKTTKVWCDLEGCRVGKTLVRPGERANGCFCVPGHDKTVADASFKYHCQWEDESSSSSEEGN